MQFRLTNSQPYLAVGLVGLGLRLLLPLGLVGLMLWLEPGFTFTKYRCEFVSLNCIFTSLEIGWNCCTHRAAVRQKCTSLINAAGWTEQVAFKLLCGIHTTSWGGDTYTNIQNFLPPNLVCEIHFTSWGVHTLLFKIFSPHLEILAAWVKFMHT